ncbi:MAG: glutamate-5-semialdehyde dehydrogenase [Acidobacteriota bacterium]
MSSDVLSESRSVAELAGAARAGQRQLGTASGETRSAVLRALCDLLEARQDAILAANRRDLEAARASALAAPLLGRLELSPAKLATLREGVATLAEQKDPIGRVRRATELDDGLVLRQVTSPLGLLLIIFESRPDAVVQIGSLALRSGNGAILKGGSEAVHSNRVLVDCLRDALAASGLAADAVCGITGRQAVAELLKLDSLIDLVIPRGSGKLVRTIQESTRIPVLGHAEGVCHLVLDASADVEVAKRLAVDGKCGYPSACNAIETLIVHRDFLPQLSAVGDALRERGVELRADDEARPYLGECPAADETDWATEYGDLVLAVRTVSDLGQALAHIERYGSAHTEALVTRDSKSRERFLREVDAASVFVNASTRFADGYRYGLGAEVGISTSRIHARGPVGVEGLLTTRWLLEGEGQIADDYGPGKRSYAHRPLTASGSESPRADR